MPLIDVRRTVLPLVAGPAMGALVLASFSSCGASVDAEPATTVATARPRGLQGPSLVPRVLLRAGGPVTCPTGAEPAVDLERAEFRPGLVGGTRLSAGAHRILVTGSVTNETNSPVQLLGVAVRVGGKRWEGAVTAPTRLPAGGGGRLVLRGTYVSRGSARARVDALLQWRWTDPALRPCGARGLLDDD